VIPATLIRDEGTMTTTQMDPAVALADLQASKPEKVTIVLLSGDLDRAMAAFIIATGVLLRRVRRRWECK